MFSRGVFHFDPQARPRIQSQLEVTRLSPLRLQALLCDRDLYQESRDEVHLLALDLFSPDSDAEVELSLNGLKLRTIPLRTDEFGVAAVVLRDLSAGRYLARCRSSRCEFTVAAFVMAPLVAQLDEMQRDETGCLDLRLRLTSYDQPVVGPVQVSLCQAGKVLDREEALARQGQLLVRFQPDGKQALQVQVQRGQDTAAVPLPGTSASQRSLTCFSTFEPNVMASLLAERDSQPRHGLHFSLSSQNQSPVQLDLDGQLTVLQPLTELLLLVLDPRDSRVVEEIRLEDVAVGHTLRLRPSAPLGWAVCATLQGEIAWQGRAALVAPEAWQPRLDLPAACRPEETIGVAISGGPERGRAWVVVRDIRATASQNVETALATSLKEHTARMATALRGKLQPRGGGRLALLDELVDQGFLTRSDLDLAVVEGERSGVSTINILLGQGLLSEEDYAWCTAGWLGLPFVDLDELSVDSEVARLIPEHLARRYCSLPIKVEDNRLTLAVTDPLNLLAIDDIRLITGFDIDPVVATRAAIESHLEDFFGDIDLSEVESTMKDISATDFGPIEVESEDDAGEPAPVLEFPLLLFAGLVPIEGGEARLDLKVQRGHYLVEATLFGPGEWHRLQGEFHCRQAPQLSLRLPTFVSPADEATGRVRAVAGSGRLEVSRDGSIVASQEVEEGQELSFACRPGHYDAHLVQADGASDRVAAEVRQPGRITQVCRTLAWLQAGESLQVGGDIFAVRQLEDLKAPLYRLTDALADFSHSCCEQTAAKMLAGMTGCFAPSPERRARGEAVILAGTERLKRMFLPGRGFALYPGYDYPNDYWGPKTVHHLWLMSSLPETGWPALNQARAEVLNMAADATLAYGLKQKDLQEMEEAYLLSVQGQAEVALNFARSYTLNGKGPVLRREDAAYGAAILLRSGEPADFVRALAWMREVLSELRATGMLYSTVDSAAAAALLSEMSKLNPVPCRVRQENGGVEVLQGAALVEVVRRRTEDWSELPATTRLDGSLMPATATLCERVSLRLTVRHGYVAGDLVWVALPDCLSRLEGGGQLKWFSLDLAGQCSARLDLAVTGTGVGTVTVILRNMFDEARASQLLQLKLEALPQPAGPDFLPDLADFTVDREVRALRRQAFSGHTEMLLEAVLARSKKSGLNWIPTLEGCRLHNQETDWQLETQHSAALCERILLEANLDGTGLAPWREFSVSALATSWGPRLVIRPGPLAPLEDSPLLPVQPRPARSGRRAAPSAQTLRRGYQEPPIVRVVNLIFSQAFNDHAEAIRLELLEKHSNVFYRFDGTWREVMTPPLYIWNDMLARLRHLAGLPLSWPACQQGGLIRLGGRVVSATFEPDLVEIELTAPSVGQPAPEVRFDQPGLTRVSPESVAALLRLLPREHSLAVGGNYAALPTLCRSTTLANLRAQNLCVLLLTDADVAWLRLESELCLLVVEPNSGPGE